MPFPKNWGETSHLLWRYRFAIVATTLIVGAVVTAVAFHLPDRYRASAMIVLRPQNFPEEYARRAAADRPEALVQVLREVLLSRSLLGGVLEEFSLYPNLRATYTTEELVELLRRDITIKLKGNDVFMISFLGPNPQTVAAVTNHLADAFVDVLRSEVKTDPISQRVLFLEARLKDLRKQRSELSRDYTGDFPEVVNLDRQIQDVTADLDRERIRAGFSGASPMKGERGEAQVLDRAVVPDKPAQPYRVLLALAGFLLGGVLATAWALFRSLADRTFRDTHDVEVFTRVPVLGVVCRLVNLEQPKRRVARAMLGVGAGVATTAGAWYLAWNFQSVVRWAALWWKGVW